jgi:hypothetical protein
MNAPDLILEDSPVEEPFSDLTEAQEVELLTDHPIRDRRWHVVKRLPDRGFYLLETNEDANTLAAFEEEFTTNCLMHLFRGAMGLRIVPLMAWPQFSDLGFSGKDNLLSD